MTEILISLSLLLLITVSDLRLMTDYLQANKANYNRTLAALRALSISELKAFSSMPKPQPPPTSTEIFRTATLMSGH
jgi:hypothetical protein